MPIEWIVGRSAALYSWDYTSGVLGQLLPASAIYLGVASHEMANGFNVNQQC